MRPLSLRRKAEVIEVSRKSERFLGLDISLTSPGFAVIEVRNREPSLITARHVKTDAKTPDGVRFSMIEAFTTVIAGEYKGRDGFAGIIREDYKRPASKRQGQTIFGAWAAVDSGLSRHGLAVTDEINAATIKRIVGGHGRADKDAVAAGVEKLLKIPPGFEFANDDESDAAAIVLAWLIDNDKITVK